jgi:hydroxymethylbilane synthase
MPQKLKIINLLNNLIINNEIDFAVHSAKDIPSKIDDRLEISGVLKRDDYHDILISIYDINSLNNKVIGTSSMRRIKELKTLNKNIIINKSHSTLPHTIKLINYSAR